MVRMRMVLGTVLHCIACSRRGRQGKGSVGGVCAGKTVYRRRYTGSLPGEIVLLLTLTVNVSIYRTRTRNGTQGGTRWGWWYTLCLML